jgi:predicted ABC-type sugar transport system permease subunit
LVGTIASILASSVFGAHCSPISDTTILSAMSTGSTLVNHIKTQAPYALLVGIVTNLFGTLIVGFEYYPPYVGSLISLVVCVVFLFLFGVHADDIEGRSPMEKLARKVWAFATRLFCWRHYKETEQSPLI